MERQFKNSPAPPISSAAYFSVRACARKGTFQAKLHSFVNLSIPRKVLLILLFAMADQDAQSSATPKKGKAAKGGKKAASAKKTKTAPSHPVVSVMVNAAVGNLKERGGSSLQAIKKYISSNYKVDADRLAPFIRKYIKKAVSDGKLVQTKGTGASGSFKMSSAADKSTQKPKAAAAKKAKKPAPAKKPVAKPKKSPVKKGRTAKPKKSPAKKAKAPAPKKAPAKKAKSTKKSPKKGKK